ncbi:dephospho-CoA kinase [Ferruginibacter lapsinanis]|uniref:dephospho-CoA kinase n=1 Tax=Ferruginibacter lapsinanis TaxID=563172 RepID=UPI001E41A1E5|nr:dephospho-CoA kinase [Ferruginibacter lapsinanis]UEG48801.1 dephospho-CoA kinase [Ferruginibacter lapsinanis]
MLKIGITGGIGSGKSVVAKVFEALGVPVYYADDASKRLMNEDPYLKQQIREKFGEASYINGQLNRPYLSSIVFKDPEKLAILNSLVHPATIKDAESWMHQQTTPYAIKEAAIIFESGSQEYLDKIIGVYAPTPLRIQRTMQRDNITREEVLSRMNKQIDEEIKMRLCDYVITNDEQQLLIPQILKIHEELLSEHRSN